MLDTEYIPVIGDNPSPLLLELVDYHNHVLALYIKYQGPLDLGGSLPQVKLKLQDNQLAIKAIIKLNEGATTNDRPTRVSTSRGVQVL